MILWPLISGDDPDSTKVIRGLLLTLPSFRSGQFNNK